MVTVANPGLERRLKGEDVGEVLFDQIVDPAKCFDGRVDIVLIRRGGDAGQAGSKKSAHDGSECHQRGQYKIAAPSSFHAPTSRLLEYISLLRQFADRDVPKAVPVPGDPAIAAMNLHGDHP